MRVARLNALDPLTHVRDKIAWLQSLTYPYVNDDLQSHAWTAVQFVFGDFYDLPCIIRNVTTSFLHFDSNTLLPEWADVDIQLEEQAPSSISVPEVRQDNASFVRFLE